MHGSKLRTARALSTAAAFALIAAALLQAPAARAQTATNVKCNGCVASKDIKDKSIKSRDIGNGQVKNADLASNAVTSGKIAGGAVANANLASNAVTSSKIATGAVGSSEVANDSLTADDLGSSSVGASEVAINSIPSTDLADEPGVEFNFVDGKFLTSSAATVVENLEITAPSDGYVVVTASGTFLSSVATTISCSLGSDTQVNLSDRLTSDLAADDNVPFSRTVTFLVSEGSITHRLVCFRTGGSGAVLADDVNIVSMFFPSRY